MRCPYCGGLNGDQAQVCIRCGRDIAAKTPPTQTPVSRQRAPYPPSPPQQPYPGPRQAQAARPTLPPAQQRVPPVAVGQRAAPVPAGPLTTPPVAPEPPAPFPPRTMAHLNAFEPGALAYSILEDTESVGRKRIVRILYPRCAPWQQMATLLKALKEQRADKFNTIIIQGSYAQERALYGFTNGQLQFDRNVRLGSQIINRYQIETDNGFEASAIRVVLSE